MSEYYDFIEEQRNTIQLGELEEHHIKSRKTYPELSEERTNILSLSVGNHDYATLLQCEEEDYPLLCPWQASRLRVSRPELAERIDYWMSRKGRESNSRQNSSQRSHAGRKSAEAARERGDLADRIERLAIINREREYPPAGWYWRINPETGEVETKQWSVPEGEGWQKGRGPNTWNKGKPSYRRRRVRCTVTGHEGTQQSLARWQKNRGIDPSNREFID